MKLLVLFVTGFAVGVAVSWVRFRETLRTYEAYIHDRLDRQLQREGERQTFESKSPTLVADQPGETLARLTEGWDVNRS